MASNLKPTSITIDDTTFAVDGTTSGNDNYTSSTTQLTVDNTSRDIIATRRWVNYHDSTGISSVTSLSARSISLGGTLSISYVLQCIPYYTTGSSAITVATASSGRFLGLYCNGNVQYHSGGYDATRVGTITTSIGVSFTCIKSSNSETGSGGPGLFFRVS